MFAQKVQMSTMLDASSPETISHLPVYTLVERAELWLAMSDALRALESLRNQEQPLREALASKIDLLRFACEQSRHRIVTRQYRDGHASLDVTFDQVRDAEHTLVALLEDIQLRESELTDMRSTYHDIALWEAR